MALRRLHDANAVVVLMAPATTLIPANVVNVDGFGL
jgi:hypothetical protein